MRIQAETQPEKKTASNVGSIETEKVRLHCCIAKKNKNKKMQQVAGWLARGTASAQHTSLTQTHAPSSLSPVRLRSHTHTHTRVCDGCVQVTDFVEDKETAVDEMTLKEVGCLLFTTTPHLRTT